MTSTGWGVGCRHPPGRTLARHLSGGEMIPALLIKERIDEIARETGEPFTGIVEDGVCYLSEVVPFKAVKAGFKIMVDELAVTKVCPIDRLNTISGVLSAARVDRRRARRRLEEVRSASAARRRDMERRRDEAIDALVEDIRNANRGRVITSG